MPITPFHMGPGLLVKALGGRHLVPFSPASVLLGVVSPGMLHVAGVLSGVLGALLLGTQFIRRRSAD
jgi:hypothetical protein